MIMSAKETSSPTKSEASSHEQESREGGRSSSFMMTKQNSTKRRASRSGSFLKRMSFSFRRSGGDRGADVETLRGTTGADWEGRAVLARDQGGAICGCFGGGGDEDRLLLIKGPFCFVYGDVTDSAPKYAISLCHMSAVVPDVSNDKVVRLETTLGEVEYVVSFEDSSAAAAFKKAVTEQAAKGEAEEVRKRLGHERLLTKRSSVKYAESVALSKVEQQPEKKVPLQAENFAALAVAVPGL